MAGEYKPYIMEAAEQASRIAREIIWGKAAKALGWEYSDAYGGYVRPDYHPNGLAHQFASYPSEIAAEDACFLDGIETLEQAQAVIAECVSCR